MVVRWTLWLVLLTPPFGHGQKFYQDDPLLKEPLPVSVEDAKPRKLNEYYDFFLGTFAHPGERNTDSRKIAAGAVNTLGEVPDSAWYVNRHGRHRMTLAELIRGPENGELPSGNWTVVASKTEGVTPGFTIKDELGRRYIVKFDPRRNREMATAADVIASRFFYALGYHVPEYHVVYFTRDRLTVAPDARIRDAFGKHRPMSERDIEDLLVRVDKDPHRGYRAVASRLLGGKILGPFRYHGTRRDDPNDVVPHEHRRDLRGLFVFSAWLAHNDVKSLNTLDTLVEENGVRYIKHYLIDFGASLGSDSFTAKSPRAGNAYLFAWKPSLLQLFSLGLHVPGWAKAHYPRFPSVGNFESRLFDPEKWKSNYPIPAFDNRLPEDEFWAAKQVMAFTNQEIQALVATGQLTDPAAEEWLSSNLVIRRDKIGRAFLKKVLPLDAFRVEEGWLKFEDLGIRYGLVNSRNYTVHWSWFDNVTQTHEPVPSPGQLQLPSQMTRSREGSYFAARISAEHPEQQVTVYIRKLRTDFQVVGIERSYEGPARNN